MKKAAALGLSLCVFAALQTFAADVSSVKGQDIGSISNVLDGLTRQQPAKRAMFIQGSNGARLSTRVRDFYRKDGRVSLSGEALDIPNSQFMLKGSENKLYGWLILHDTKQAYEYTTDATGHLIMTPVAISKIVPDYDESFSKAAERAIKATATATVAHPVYSSMALRQAPHIGPYNNEDVTKLESKPGSPYVFYLNTAAVMSGNTPINGVTKEQMYRAWQATADQYSMLNLNVTTNKAVYDAAKAANVTRTGVINFVNQDGRSNAPLHAFGTTSAGTLYRNPATGFDYGYGIGMTCAHEVGHEMGMSHDGGGTGGEYYEGIAAYQWGPIMGNYWMGASWTNQLFTWSRGEYSTASNQEDDLRIMSVDEGVPYMADDNPTDKPLVVGSDGSIDPTRNFGQIERNTDTDTFTFTVQTGGRLNLRVDPIEYLRMLDVDASILDASGAVVARSNLAVNRSAEFVNLNLAAGNYRLVIKGGAEGTPQNGFSNYSSLGWYAMKGTLEGGIVPPSDPVLSNNVALGGQTATAGTWKYYTIDVPAGKTSLTVSTAGSTGDADLFVQVGAKPTTSSYKCKSDGPTATESCSIANPAAGKYYVGVYAYSAFNNLSVTAKY
ncbi:pre-peptidase C-terminal domain-containing protein [Burkholderiaceae bacterium DAT-1]|nr:pre-peptidase C-terminal domain-containing protein [Burkholderiaceae bacterium DAT-1]